MKKIVTLALAAFMICGILAGCAQEAPAEEATASPTQAKVTTAGGAEAVTLEEDMAEEEQEPPSTLPADASPTTGKKGTTTQYRPIIVQIENEEPARPQRGIQMADIVYETLIEWIDTRFTCIFNDVLYSEGAPAEIEVGPVRSSRYYHQWMQGEWDALYVHVGGAETPGLESYIWGESANHIKQRINSGTLRPTNEELIYRRKNTGKRLEHTAYTDIVKDVEIYEYEPKQRRPLNYYPLEDYANEPEIEKIEMAWWSNKMNFIEYRYDKEKDKLIRYMEGKEFMAEETGAPLEVQNLIVQYVSCHDFPNEGGRKQINVFGSGPAEFIVHGKHLKGTWERKDNSVSTIYRLENGDEVTLTPGNTWIEMHPNDRRVTITYADGTTFEQNADAPLMLGENLG